MIGAVPEQRRCACCLLELERRPARELLGVACAGCGAESPVQVLGTVQCRVGGGTAEALVRRKRAEAQAAALVEAAAEMGRLEDRGMTLLREHLQEDVDEEQRRLDADHERVLAEWHAVPGRFGTPARRRAPTVGDRIHDLQREQPGRWKLLLATFARKAAAEAETTANTEPEEKVQ